MQGSWISRLKPIQTAQSHFWRLQIPKEYVIYYAYTSKSEPRTEVCASSTLKICLINLHRCMGLEKMSSNLHNLLT